MDKQPPSVKAVFDHALEIEAPLERAAYLDKTCAESPELRRKVEALLKAYADAGDFLEGPAVDPGATLDPPENASASGSPNLIADGGGSPVPGAHIGPYKLLQRLGEGGMGSVFMAEQEHPVKRRVALKIIKPGMDSAHVLARFEAERQALALMDHPNIAKVLDAGATPPAPPSQGGEPRTSPPWEGGAGGGRPYFVMELVKGIPITKYCDQERLRPRERLELFVPVCQAVQHAHQKGIIHRDLKPSNVLIALYDGKPVPKVIDFGVAKATAQKLTERTMFTEVGQIVGTLEYMSPEQAELNQLDVDTRSDIYSLGVLLYELLTGSPPFTAKELRSAGFTAMLRIIREVEPTRPSMKLSGSDELPAIAAKRKMEPRRLAKLVHGDLDWIVMKCLEKERGRRYETANGLSQDIGRYLSDEPVEAGPPGAGYRLRKFVRRNRGPVLAASLVFLALVAGIVGTSTGLMRAMQAEDQAVRERDDKEEARADAVAQAKEAQQQTQLAEKAREELRSTLYASDLNLIHTAWDAGDIGRVRELLDRQRPKVGEKELRGFEWHYWHRLCNADLRTVKLPGLTSNEATFSRDGKRLVAVVRTEPQIEIQVWDTATGQVVQQFKVPRAFEGRQVPMRPAISPDGTRVAMAYMHLNFEDLSKTINEVKVWDTATGKELHQSLPLGLLKGFFLGVTFSPDGSRIAMLFQSVGKNAEFVKAELRTRDAVTGDPGLSFEVGVSVASQIAYSPDGSRLAVSVPAKSGGEIIKIFDAVTGKTLLQIDGTFSGIPEYSFSPDGSRLAVKDRGRTHQHDLTVWDAVTGKKMLATRADLGEQYATLAFSPDGKHLAVGGRLGIKVWEVASVPTGGTIAPPLTFKGHNSLVTALVFNADGSRLLSSSTDGTVKEWLVSDLKPPLWTTEWYPAAFSKNRERAVLRAWNIAKKTGEILILETSSGRELARYRLPIATGLPPLVTMSLDGVRVVLTTVVVTTDQNTEASEAIVIEASSGREIGRFTIPSPEVRRPLWIEAIIGREIAPFAMASRLAMSPDGKRFAWFESIDRKHFKLRTCEVEAIAKTAERPVIRTLKDFFARSDNADALADVEFFPDGDRLGILSQVIKKDLRNMANREVLDFTSGKGVFTLPGERPSLYGGSVFFSPDGRILAAYSQVQDSLFDVTVWQGETGKLLRAFQFEAASPDLVFSPDGARLLGLDRHPVKAPVPPVLWDLETGKELLRLKGHSGSLLNASFSPDGSRIVSVCASGSGSAASYDVKVWNAATGQELLAFQSSGYDPRTLAFSPDGHRLWAVNPSPRHPRDLLKIWDATPLPEK